MVKEVDYLPHILHASSSPDCTQIHPHRNNSNCIRSQEDVKPYLHFLLSGGGSVGLAGEGKHQHQCKCQAQLTQVLPGLFRVMTRLLRRRLTEGFIGFRRLLVVILVIRGYVFVGAPSRPHQGIIFSTCLHFNFMKKEL